ncbi:hypothetical protein V2J09_012918 [Rumex salicifolius]
MDTSEKGRDLHLTKDERIIVQEEEDTHTGHLKIESLTLMGSLLTSKPFNSFALKATMKGAVLKGAPWLFDKSLLVLKELGDEQPFKMTFDKAKLWVRIYDLPMSMMNLNMAKKFGASIGKVSEK